MLGCAVLCCASSVGCKLRWSGGGAARLPGPPPAAGHHCALRPTPGTRAAAPSPQQLSPDFRATQVGWRVTKYQENIYFSLMSRVWPEQSELLSLVLTRSAAARPAQHRAAPPDGAAQTPQQITSTNI